MNREEILSRLVDALASMGEVTAVGTSGDGTLPAPGEGDIDLFVYGRSVPSGARRRAALEPIAHLLGDIETQVFESHNWGSADRVSLDGVETWLMFFAEGDVIAEVEALLNGERRNREGNYYPIGRCAMLQGIGILYDRNGFLASLKARLAAYPAALAQILVDHHLGCLDDSEDFERPSAARMPCSITMPWISPSTISCRRYSHSTPAISPAGNVRCSTSAALLVCPRTVKRACCTPWRAAAARKASPNRMPCGAVW
jgi:hypothetical protein